ncbi:biotin transporter BioY [Desulfolucanica intricata]|uniref:biotin transporter BioY n=1 Tax=Desulfolucanica intricata TaxID=1285191 RepID=UPI0008365F94|nr:biotin transporter BioY [Desulfolucanica intricata]
MKFTPRDITLTAMFAALTAIVAVLGRFGVTAIVPFSLQPLVALLAGGILGARLGAVSMLVYVLMGLIGLPVFEKVPFGGPAYVLQPTFGFLIGLIAAAYLTGKFLEGKQDKGFWHYYGAMLIGLAVIYLLGLPYLYAVLNIYLGQIMSVWRVLEIGFIPFIAFDLIKAIISAVIAKLVYKRINPVMEKR